MYGNFEYGSVSYGDILTAIIIPVVSLKDIEILFISARRPSLFISGKKKYIFKAEPYTGRRIDAKNL